LQEIIDKLQPYWFKKAGATIQQIGVVETLLGRMLPAEYKEFLLWSNGGEGKFFDNYLSLWQIEELPTLNADYKINVYLPNVIAIGSNGGGEGIILDFNNSVEPALKRVPFGDLDFASSFVLGESFKLGLSRYIRE
jgi:SMI1 / KNR4 family (SUKH-1)